MPAALVPRPWDFDLPPGKPDLIPVHENDPLKQIPPPDKAEDGSGPPSGDLPPVPSHDGFVPFPTSPELDTPGADDETLTPPPSVTITPPTLRGPPPTEVQIQA